ncbi:unnamed protein product [Sympodiomycopsis kandeliae]
MADAITATAVQFATKGEINKKINGFERRINDQLQANESMVDGRLLDSESRLLRLFHELNAKHEDRIRVLSERHDDNVTILNQRIIELEKRIQNGTNASMKQKEKAKSTEDDLDVDKSLLVDDENGLAASATASSSSLKLDTDTCLVDADKSEHSNSSTDAGSPSDERQTKINVTSEKIDVETQKSAEPVLTPSPATPKRPLAATVEDAQEVSSPQKAKKEPGPPTQLLARIETINKPSIQSLSQGESSASSIVEASTSKSTDIHSPPGTPSGSSAPVKGKGKTKEGAASSSTDGKAKPVKKSPSSTTKKNSATANPWANRVSAQKGAESVYAQIPPFVNADSLEHWMSKIDDAWYGTSDEFFRADLLSCIKHDTNPVMRNWIKRTPTEFLHEATWPDIKTTIRRTFNPPVSSPEEYYQWQTEMLAIAPGFVPRITLDLSPFGSNRSNTATSAAPRTAGLWGSSLSNARLAGAFGTAARRGSGAAATTAAAGGARTSSSNDTTSAVNRDSSSTDSQSKSQSASAGPANKSDTTTDPANADAEGDSSSTGSKATNSKTSTGKDKQAEAGASAKKSRDKKASKEGSSGPSVGTTRRGSTPASPSASSPSITPKSANVKLAESLVASLGKYDGSKESFLSWSRRVDAYYYRPEECTEYEEAFLFALSKTFTSKASEWLSICNKDWLEYSTWNDWKMALSEYIGGAQYDLLEDPSVLILMPHPCRLFSPFSPHLPQYPVPILVKKAEERRFK